MTINYWTGFSKRKNSTKTPTSGTSVTAYLKEDTTILNPSIDSATIPANANYMYIADFGRYYFVRNVTKVGANRNLFELEVDPMATYKSTVGSYNGLIEFAASSSNLVVTDPRNKPTQLVTSSSAAMTFTSNPFNATGTYIIGVLSDHANGSTGVITYYALTIAEMQLFAAELYSQTFIARIIDQFNAVQDSLVSCIWVPLETTYIPGTDNMKIHIGREVMDAEGRKIATRKISMTTGTVSLTFPSGAGAGGDMVYIDKSPYTTATMYLPFVGVVSIDTDIAAFTKSVQVDAYVDVFTGDIVYKISYGGAFTSTFNGNIATKMPVTGASYDAVGVASGSLSVLGGIAATIGAIVSGGASAAVTAAIGTAAGGMMTAKSLELHTMINGTGSSAIGAELGLNPWYAIYTYVPTTGATSADLLSFQTEQGMPYFKVDTISNLSGFVKCANASISITGTPQEKDTVTEYMNEGFYYE